MFKEGDFIKVKPNTTLESGEIVNNWAGKVQEVNGDAKCCLIKFDAQTIDSLDDSFLQGSIDEGAEPFEYVFEFNDLELSERRDTDILVMKALVRLASRVNALEGGDGEEQEFLKREWIEEFENSAFFDSLNEVQKEHSDFVLSTFMEFIHNYEYVLPKDWEPTHVESVCLDVVPRKITSHEELFENYGDILIPYLRFLGQKNYIANSNSLIQTVEKIKSQIPIEAQNSNNWGMAKSMIMSAQQQGFDMTEQEDIDRFMMLQQLNALNELNKRDEKNKPISRGTLSKEDPFKEIGRNQKVTVKYNDGKVLKDVKFKKVESDLRNGICEII